MLGALKENPAVTDVRGRGLMFAVDIRDEKTGNRVFAELIENGYIVGNRKTFFRIDPPLIITEDECGDFVNAFRQAPNHTLNA